MAPVGCWESLAAAIQAGATSVYFGIEHLNMRARSSVNFTTEDLHTIAATCRQAGVKTYLTLNTVMYPEDLPLMREIVDNAQSAGIDAIIASGMFTNSAVLRLISRLISSTPSVTGIMYTFTSRAATQHSMTITEIIASIASFLGRP